MVLLKLFVVGFVSFFATGLDDTLAYAPFMRSRRDKVAVSSGIITATLVDLLIAVFLAGVVAQLPYTHLIGGGGLIILGLWVIWGKGLEISSSKLSAEEVVDKRDAKGRTTAPSAQKLFFVGFATFFLTGIDDTLAYSLLLTTPAAFVGITLGIFAATFVDLLLVFFLSEKLGKLRHTREIGGAALIVLGLLLCCRLL